MANAVAQAVTSQTAPLVCIPCKARKRRCDKKLPSCSLCERLSRPCSYAEPPDTSKSTEVIVRTTSSARTSPRTPEFPFRISQSSLFDVHFAITGEVSRSIGDVDVIGEIAANYFKTVHLWLPILPKAPYYERLPKLFSRPDAGFSLLSLCVALITVVPDGRVSSMTQLPLYALAKSSIAIIEAANIHSLEIVQSRLLVSVFEVGHGIHPTASVSIAALVNAATVIGLHQKSDGSLLQDTENQVTSDEKSLLWWGIVMLDRFHTLSSGVTFCITQNYTTPDYLPTDNNYPRQKIYPHTLPLSLFTPSTIHVGPFGRQAQVSHVIQRLLTHLDAPTPHQRFNLEESAQLARTLSAFTKLLPEEDLQPWPRYCGAIGTCYSAMLTLHEHSPNFKVNEIPQTQNADQPSPASEPTLSALTPPQTLNTTLSHIALLSSRFNKSISAINLESLSPFVSHSLFKAAVAIIRTGIGYSGSAERLSSLETMLGHFGGRWLNAGKYLERLKAVKVQGGLIRDSDGCGVPGMMG